MAQQCLDRDIRITRHEGRVTVSFHGAVVATSTHALALHEGDYPVRYYIPQSDVEQAVLSPSTHTTHCPFKGDASYYHLSLNGHTAANAAWFYAQACPQVRPIEHHLSFWGDDVAVEVKAAT